MLVTCDFNPVLFLFYTERTPGDAWRARKCVSAHAPGILDSRNGFSQLTHAQNHFRRQVPYKGVCLVGSSDIPSETLKMTAAKGEWACPRTQVCWPVLYIVIA